MDWDKALADEADAQGMAREVLVTMKAHDGAMVAMVQLMAHEVMKHKRALQVMMLDGNKCVDLEAMLELCEVKLTVLTETAEVYRSLELSAGG